MSTAMSEWPRRHRITVEHYYRMAEAGLFGPDERVELISGEIVDMPPMGSRHAAVLEQLDTILTRAVGDRAIVRPQLPVRLADDSEPEPDIAVVRGRADRYRSMHPEAADVLLLIEISDATLGYELEVKVPLYARCAIPEVWVVDLAGSKVHVFRTPASGVYARLSAADEHAAVQIEALPGIAVDLAALLREYR